MTELAQKLQKDEQEIVNDMRTYLDAKIAQVVGGGDAGNDSASGQQEDTANAADADKGVSTDASGGSSDGTGQQVS